MTEGLEDARPLRKALAAITASLMVATAAPVVAIADDTTATNSQTGTGTTELTIQVNNDGPHSGTDDPTNPDEDGDGLGDVIAFTVPSKVNFVVKSNGELIAPSAEQTYIENRVKLCNLYFSSDC